jgi:putative transposase
VTNYAWSLDLVANRCTGTHRSCALAIVDVFTLEALAIAAGRRLTTSDVARVRDEHWIRRGAPHTLLCGKGSDSGSQMTDLWAYHHKIETAFSRPCTSADNAFVTSINGVLRDEWLNAHWFTSLTDAKEQIEQRRVEYSESRPHKALGEVSSAEYARQSGLRTPLTDQQDAQD